MPKFPHFLLKSLLRLLCLLLLALGGELYAQEGPTLSFEEGERALMGGDYLEEEAVEELPAPPPQRAVTEYRLPASTEESPSDDPLELKSPTPITVRTFPPGLSGTTPGGDTRDQKSTPLPLPMPGTQGGQPSQGSTQAVTQTQAQAQPKAAAPQTPAQPKAPEAKSPQEAKQSQPAQPAQPAKPAQAPPKAPAANPAAQGAGDVSAKDAPKNPSPAAQPQKTPSPVSPSEKPQSEKAQNTPPAPSQDATPKPEKTDASPKAEPVPVTVPYNPGREVTAENVEEVLTLPLEGEVEGSSGLLIWKENRLYRRNPDGSLTLMDNSLDVQTDAFGQKWLDYDEAGNAIIQVSLKVWATINFAYDSTEITEDSVKVLEAFGRALNTPALKDSSLLIAGHTDNNGPSEYNIKLSRERANAVSKWLTDNMGIAQERLICTGYGSNNPIADNATFEGQAKNRRVEFVLLPEVNEPS